MSRKQTVKARPNKKAELERKRDEKAVRRALAKERKNRAQGGGSSDDEEFVSFTNQLQAMGLKIREVPGDGNCLFRALGDQLEGHSRNHLKHRQETVDFMLNHREDFEPFVEDDVPFERHVANLRKPGTFAGNDAIVAFARNNRANVVIHQLNAPLWQICGLDKPDARELHIAYRYGEHYDSVRRISDNSEAPASLKTEMFSKDESNKKGKNKLQNYQVEEIADFEEELTDEVADAIQKVCNATGCTDNDLITQNLEAENYDIESTILAVLQVTELKHFSDEEEAKERSQSQQIPPSQMENGSGTKVFGNQHQNSGGTENNRTQANTDDENKTNKSAKLSNKQRKEQQRQEKKKRQEERHRQKVRDSRSNNAENSEMQLSLDTEVALVKAVATLTI